ncbi:unnamed protein product [Medioppia subpectinata]|uniref:Uncharacterized protein n=1 Tax=Medioppia subpectinata TaxID=1979941 RepID=A0A7R9L2V0_9ACAR|nr:unnamed protein product [Medioppia subpectinata]CAG2113390.1 unnamed protein product [Medioppia subpectinata]
MCVFVQLVVDTNRSHDMPPKKRDSKPEKKVCDQLNSNCHELNDNCIECKVNYSCVYGQQLDLNCRPIEGITCIGETNFTRRHLCAFCYQLPQHLYNCWPNSSCDYNSRFTDETGLDVKWIECSKCFRWYHIKCHPGDLTQLEELSTVPIDNNTWKFNYYILSSAVNTTALLSMLFNCLVLMRSTSLRCVKSCGTQVLAIEIIVVSVEYLSGHRLVAISDPNAFAFPPAIQFGCVGHQCLRALFGSAFEALVRRQTRKHMQSHASDMLGGDPSAGRHVSGVRRRREIMNRNRNDFPVPALPVKNTFRPSTTAHITRLCSSVNPILFNSFMCRTGDGMSAEMAARLAPGLRFSFR